MKPLIVLAGPCVLEDEGLALEVAHELKRQLGGLPIDFFFKASFDKANRTSIDGFRGPGMKDGLKTLSKIKSETGHRVVTDIHSHDQAAPVAEVADMIQIPAFLCRQTDLVLEAAKEALTRKKRLNIKKGQFLAPWDAKNIVEKTRSLESKLGKSFAPDGFTITERGASFGYNSLIVDMSSFQIIQGFGVPVIYDATHSVQVPGMGPGGKSTGGKREILESLARAAVAAGADGVFLECHPEPSKAKSDGPNAFYLSLVGKFIQQLLEIRHCVTKLPRLLPEAQTDLRGSF